MKNERKTEPFLCYTVLYFIQFILHCWNSWQLFLKVLMSHFGEGNDHKEFKVVIKAHITFLIKL